MNYLIILAHPDTGSFNASMANTVRNRITESGGDVILHDLYLEGFDPVLSFSEINRKYSFDKSIQNYSAELTNADHLIFIHPDWWGQMPGILKGWIDRIFTQGTAYEYGGLEFEEKTKVPLLTGKSATVIITTDREKEPLAIEQIWKNDILDYCGITDSQVFVHYSTRISDTHKRSEFLNKVLNGVLRDSSGVE